LGREFYSPSSSRVDRLRLRHWLHVSLAYGFVETDHEPLAALARRTVSVSAPAFWSLGIFQRHEDKTWTCHGRWLLANTKETV
jgi:hypothetical protein